MYDREVHVSGFGAWGVHVWNLSGELVPPPEGVRILQEFLVCRPLESRVQVKA